eukprot:828789-Alexandrium_andersonii.AAC.1
METRNLGYPLEKKTVESCVAKVQTQFGAAPVPVSFSLHRAGDGSQYIKCASGVTQLPRAASGTWEVHNDPCAGKQSLWGGTRS